MSDSRKELEAVLWAGADVLRSKMDANEYKDYLLSFVFYKYLSDTFLVKAYDLIEDCEPESIEEAQRAYEEAYAGEDAADLLNDLRDSCRYVIEPHLTFHALAKQAANNEFKREDLKKAFNDIETSDPIFNGLFADVDLYASRLGLRIPDRSVRFRNREESGGVLYPGGTGGDSNPDCDFRAGREERPSCL